MIDNGLTMDNSNNLIVSFSLAQSGELRGGHFHFILLNNHYEDEDHHDDYENGGDDDEDDDKDDYDECCDEKTAPLQLENLQPVWSQILLVVRFRVARS